jgi:fatty-acyl-CoA synthase
MRAGMLEPGTPGAYARLARALTRYGPFGALGFLGGGLSPERTALIDDAGRLSFGEINGQINALANAWRARGFKPGDAVAIMTRNHRGFVLAAYAAARCGARTVLLNTGFSPPQVETVIAREGADLVIYDEEFGVCFARLHPRYGCWRAWCDTRPDGNDTVAAQIAGGDRRDPPRPGRPPRVIVLTSGTTGAPRGAGRDVPFSLSPIGGALTMVPFKACEPTQISAPLFHALGFTQLLLAVALRSTLVLQRWARPEELLASLSRNKVTAVVTVPVILQRLVSLPADVLAAHDVSQLRIIYVSGSQLTPALAAKATAVFGPVLYNVYASTEIAYGTIASPADLAAAPGTVGRVAPGTSVSIVGPDGQELTSGQTGRIFVGNLLKFEGYTGGSDRPRFHGKVSSGDVGHFDADGRLFIDGREDEMVISGGENVFPAELEQLLAGHPAVADVAVVGVDDEEFGQRLKAYVVRVPGAKLSEADVKAYVRANLARYKVPRDVEFLDVLPRNPTGKVLKGQLVGQGSLEH